MTGNEPTVTSDRTEAFLDIEAQAQTLVSRLSRLDKEANRYSNAASNLEKAAQATNDLVKVFKAVARGSINALDVVASAGGPEILAQLSTLSAHQEELSSALNKKVTLAVLLSGVSVTLALVALVVALIQWV